MFTYKLPYSHKTHKIKTLTFQNMWDMSRLISEDNDIGLRDYIEELFNLQTLNIVDSVYICLKAREIFIDNNITLGSQSGNVNLGIGVLLNSLTNIQDKSQTIKHNNIEVTLDVPSRLLPREELEDVFSNIIHSIRIDGVSANIHEMEDSMRNYVISKLPGTILTSIGKYLQEVGRECILYEGKQGLIGRISFDLYNHEPFNFIKSIYGDYTLNYCRDVIMSLSRVNGQTLLQSTPSDVAYYIEEINRQKEQDSGKNEISL
jgi:hypothetical protein